jgi:hypothetical protein
MIGGPIKTFALYTTIYPGVEPYLLDWYRSVCEQTDHDFQLWIGVDGIEIEAAKEAMGADLKANWVPAPSGETPAQIRQRALVQITEAFDGVVLVDSDDVLHPTRVAAAKSFLQECDLAGCALRLVDQQRVDLGLNFGLPSQASPEDVLPRHNVFGLSNTAFRSDLLRQCLPIPDDVVLVDWFLATQAWLHGARLAFDTVVRMDYRQHSKNMVRVWPPFRREQVIQDTERVRQHFKLLSMNSRGGAISERITRVERVATDVEAFYHHVVLRPEALDRYIDALNLLNPPPLWWSSVAHPSLCKMWNKGRNNI